LTNRERDYCQGRIFCCAGCELAACRISFQYRAFVPTCCKLRPQAGGSDGRCQDYALTDSVLGVDSQARGLSLF
jgi:hypothetical protein